ncbi:MAG: glycosyltransferase family 9 protein [Desulfobacula sp.]|nr:glycosyltransferase family 9 protein [Desulfobacula sp.]
MFDNIKKILIIKPSALGDIVHSLPFLSAIKNKFPNAKIDWVVAHGLHTFLEDHPLIDNLWVIKKDQWKKLVNLNQSLKEINILRKGLKTEHYDVSIDLSGLLRSGIISWFSKASVKLGFKESDEGSPFFYTHKIHGSMNIHAIDRYLEIAKFMGCATGEFGKISKIDYPFAPYDHQPEILKELPKKYLVMSPSAGKPANRWQAEKYGRLAGRLNLPTVIIASAAESDIAQEVVNHSNGNAINLAGRTGLKELIAVIEKASCFVCNDTGPMHIAAALDIPVFAVFGPANPIRTGPYGTIHTVIQKNYDCSPCYAQQPCSKYDFRCMNELGVDDVLKIINEKMGVL